MPLDNVPEAFDGTMIGDKRQVNRNVVVLLTYQQTGVQLRMKDSVQRRLQAGPICQSFRQHLAQTIA